MKQLFALITSFQLICAPLMHSVHAATSEIATTGEIAEKQALAAQAGQNAETIHNQGNNTRQKAANLEVSRFERELNQANKNANAARRELADKERELKNLRASESASSAEIERLNNEIAAGQAKVTEAEKVIAAKNSELSRARDYAKSMAKGEFSNTAVKVTDANEEKYKNEVGTVDAGENPEYDNKAQMAGGFGHYSKQLLGVATSIVGSSIIEQCSFGLKIPSIATYMAGSITYLISEITGGQNQNTEQKERLARIEELKKQIAENKGGGDVQRVLLEQRLKEEQDLSAFVSERITWLTAVMLMYTVAAGLAIMEETQGIAMGVVAANTACSGVAATMCSGSGPGYPACYAAKYAMCVTASPVGYAAANGASASPASVPTGQSAAASTGPNAPGAMGYLTAYLSGAYAGCTPLSMGTVSVGAFSANLISFAYGMGFSMGENSMVGYVKLATAILNYLIPGIKQLVVAAYNYPIPRAITFGVSAALVGAIIASLNQIKSQTEGNISQISKVVDDFKQATNDTKGMNQGQGLATDNGNQGTKGGQGEIGSVNTDGKSYSVGNNGTVTKLNPGVSTSKTKQCFANEKGNMSFDSPSCSKPVNIKPVVVKVKGNQSTLKTAAGLINEIANDMASGDRTSANLKMGQLNAMASAINSEVDKLKSDYNKNQKKNKKDTLDFDGAIAKEMKKYDDLYESEKNKALKDEPKLASLAASFSNRRGLGLDASQTDASAGEVNTASADSAIALPSGLAQKTSEESLLTEGISEDSRESIEDSEYIFGGDVTSNNPDGLNEDAYRAALANGYLGLHGRLGRGDGVASSQENLFKVISHRYFLSYPKIMRKKIPEAAKAK